MIVKGKLSDTKKLTEIALTSKAFWGYSKENIASWRSDLTVTSKMIEECDVFKFLQNDKIAGFYILNPPEKTTYYSNQVYTEQSRSIEESLSVELEMLFVLPEFIGKGIGKQLLQHSFEKAQKLNCESMTLLADPNAVPFYSSQGFYEIDKKESSIPNRFLPVMQKDLV